MSEYKKLLPASLAPSYFGPSYWFVLHTTAKHYPKNPSPIVIERMKNFILAIPYTLPCETCQVHAIQYISNCAQQLDKICSTQETLFKFFVDFHNAVNKRLNKPFYSYEEASKLYF